MTMPDFKPVRLGVIGAGYIATIHAEAAALIPSQVEMVAAVDANPVAAATLAERFGWEKSYSGVAEMLGNEVLDGVIIATWPSTHLQLIRQCIDAGIRYVLCEKPLLLTGKEALEVWSLVNESGTTLTEAFMYRHHPALQRVDEILASHQLGVIDHVRASFSYVNQAAELGIDPRDPSRPWRFQADQGGGALHDIGAYAINACTHVAAAVPTRVASFGRARNEYGTSDKVIGLIDYANGVVGMIEASEICDSTQELQISAELGTLYLPFTWTIYGESYISIRRSIGRAHRDPARVFRTIEDRLAVAGSNAFRDQLLNVAESIRGVASPRVSLAETVVNTITMEALARSLKEREEVEVTVPNDVTEALMASPVAVPNA